ncbi:hypothetical protein D1816_22820 [Aquimarina sp. AD10]|uniref:hypothetical protein n=1 Tax=Aquimarina sp. AD10 TaxID=1714849 RepID=UPI000E4BFC7C|nr:hypothetical protein [Aquimarina sp. AD10]AXT63056.1 hypothetical protein D1816_22820 [Aquimarina sp. AD10]RKM96857.1 hypothetical protein D7033_15195 [Aquimarina sp. AD10]
MEQGFIKIIECFNITAIGLLTELQHSENGIPPNTQIFDPITNETWIVKKRVHHGILILDRSEKYFDCETESMHVDSVFKNLKDREIAVEKELNKRKNGIYSYLIETEKKKQKIKPEIGSKLKIKLQHNKVYKS